MPRHPLNVHLLVPGLLGPWPAAGRGMPLPACPALGRWLNRAGPGTGSGPGLHGALAALFGLAAAPGGDLPVAALSRLADTGESDPGWWLRADPVHLRPDRDTVRLFGPSLLDLTRDEADALAETVRGHFAADGWDLEVSTPARWYLSPRTVPGIRTSPLEAVLGDNVDDHLPAGPDALQWHGWLNEAQMLLHGHPVNAAREAAGRPAVNGLWLWGGGRLPAEVRAPWDRLWADAPFALGLAAAAGVARSDVPDDAEALLAAGGGRHLVVLDAVAEAPALGDAEAWHAQVARWERDWFAPLLRGLRRGAMDTLVLDPADGRRFALSRAGAWRWWRRGRDLAPWLTAPR